MLALSQAEAIVFLPFVTPVCLWVIYSDLSRMKITNPANIALLAVFVLLGLFVLPFGEYGWRLVQVVIMLGIGILANAMGLMGAGDSKFLATAAAFVAPRDILTVLLLLSAITVVALVVHRLARASSLRTLAPDWVSWNNTKKFPLGLALGSALVAYLVWGLFNGA